MNTEIARLYAEINRKEKAIENLQTNLGQILRSLQITKLFGDFRYFDKPLIVGNFKFDCYDHDTGIDVNVWIVDGDDKYQIINKTYWKSAGYRSSEDYWKCGAWDKKLGETIQMFKTKLEDYYLQEIESLKSKIERLKQYETDKKDKFEGLFR